MAVPDASASIGYTFVETETAPAASISLEKEVEKHLRIVSWNTLKDGLLKDGRAEHFRPILMAVAPDVINLQDLVNGIDWIAEHLKGRICIDLDIDRQNVTRFGSPADIDALIREEVEKLGNRNGGLMMIYGLYPGVPLENVKALMDAMERYSTYYS